MAAAPIRFASRRHAPTQDNRCKRNFKTKSTEDDQ
jgi:hypothetical protein